MIARIALWAIWGFFAAFTTRTVEPLGVSLFIVGLGLAAAMLTVFVYEQDKP